MTDELPKGFPGGYVKIAGDVVGDGRVIPPGFNAALDRFIREERPGMSREEARDFLAAEALIGMGILTPPGRD